MSEKGMPDDEIIGEGGLLYEKTEGKLYYAERLSDRDL